MDIYDSQRVQELWQRVLQPSEATVPPEKLEEWLALSAGGQRSYEAMARQSRPFAPVFRAMARREMQQARRLQALRWLLYGRRDRILGSAAEGKRRFAFALRSRYEAEKEAAREFRAAAKTYPQQKDLLDDMANTAEAHCRMLQRVAEGLV